MHQADEFKQQLRDSLQRETQNSRAFKIARHANVYTAGDQDEAVYFIESGQIKLLMLSPGGKERLLAIHSFLPATRCSRASEPNSLLRPFGREFRLY
jgi:CRP-like cAMP-binding protein